MTPPAFGSVFRHMCAARVRLWCHAQVIWPALVTEFEWTRMVGPRPTDSYFLPKGVVRGQNGAKCRENYFDSYRQVRVR